MGAYASGKNALGICDRCGTAHKLLSLRFEVVNFRKTGMRVCEDCFDPDHPQYQLNRLRMDDPQALQDARPDTHTDRDAEEDVSGNTASASVGSVTVNIS